MTTGTVHLGRRFWAQVATPAREYTAANTPPSPYERELDTGWAETLSIMSNEPFFSQVRNGLAQMRRGESVAFEEIFGEPL